MGIFMRIWGLFYMKEIIIRSYQGQGSFTNLFFSNLNIVNLKTFPNHGGIYTSK